MRNTEKLISFEEVKEHRSEIVPRISEGCIELEKIINYCIDSNISTIACCAGHRIGDFPYITMVYDKYTRKKINAFLNKLKDVKDIQIMFSTTGFTNNPFNVTIYTKRKNRDKVFSIINKSLENNNEDDYLNENINTILRVAINMDYRSETFSISIYNKKFQKKYMAIVYGTQAKENIFEKSKNGIKIGIIGAKAYLYKENRNLEVISNELESLCPNYYLENGYKISSTASVIEKIELITDYNQKMYEQNGTVRRNL